MFKITISKSEVKKIILKKKAEKDRKIYRRLQFLHLRYKNKSNKEIADIIGVCPDTITNWSSIYSDKGLDGLCQPINYDNRSSKIDPHIDNIKKDLQENIISTLAELQDWIKDEYKIELEQSWLSRCCKKNSISLTRNHV